MLYLWIGLGILGGVALVFAFVWVNNRALVTTHYGISADVQNDVRIVHLSDLHGARFGAKNRRLLKRVEKQSPDFIAITGDIIHKYRERDIAVALELVPELIKIAPVLFVAGNHEMRNLGYRQFKEKLTAAGALVLDDCTADICGLTVVGLNCASLKNDKISKVTPQDKEGGATVLLAHMPQFAQKYSKYGYDLVLCGHAHGGQWRIPFTGQGLYAPGQGVFPKLTSGMKKYGGTSVVISRGLGNSQCPLRLFNIPEVIVIDIKKR